MKRRAFITLLGGAAALPLAHPFAARAQQAERTRRVGMLFGGTPASDPEVQARIAALMQGLAQLGWSEGRNLRVDYRSGVGNAADIRKYAAELVALGPDVIVNSGTATMAALLQATRDSGVRAHSASEDARKRADDTRPEAGSSARAVPIVFVNVADPVGAGFVDSMARPGGNATGFVQLEYNLAGKWLELLKEVAPGMKRAAVLRDAAITGGIGQFAIIQAVAPSLGVEVTPVNLRAAAAEVERAVTAFARSGNGGLIGTASALSAVHRDLIITLAARHKLPAIYFSRQFVGAGGLMSYGANIVDQFRQAASYVDRILKGEKPADLPVQAPTRYELIINLKTAKALGIAIPPTLLARADEVIE